MPLQPRPTAGAMMLPPPRPKPAPGTAPATVAARAATGSPPAAPKPPAPAAPAAQRPPAQQPPARPRPQPEMREAEDTVLRGWAGRVVDAHLRGGRVLAGRLVAVSRYCVVLREDGRTEVTVLQKHALDFVRVQEGA